MFCACDKNQSISEEEGFKGLAAKSIRIMAGSVDAGNFFNQLPQKEMPCYEGTICLYCMRF